MQRAAEGLIARAVAGQSDRVSAAAILADHSSGEILAEIGTAAYGDTPRDGFVDMTRALRSPGSTLKPFVYALGFDDGLIHPETLIEDRPAIFGRWQPQNFDRHFRGTVTIRRALQDSLNIPVVRVAEALGPARIMATLRRAGMQVEVKGGTPGLALVLGGAGVSLYDLVGGYAALAEGGQTVALHETHRQGDPGAQSRLVGRAAAWQIGHILSRLPPPQGRGWSDIGYHHVIQRDGSLGVGRPLWQAGAHTRGQNGDSIGICLMGGHGSSADDRFEDNFTELQDHAARMLIEDLRAEYGALTLHGHNEFAAKACPGFRVTPWAEARGLLL